MSAAETPKHYDAEAARKRYYNHWEAQGFFKGNPEAPGESFSMVIPPPNVTGSLHMGHALNNTLQDTMARYHRMIGKNVVWIPGCDHASIAVHWVLERKFREEGTNRFDLGREEFLKRAWAFKNEAESNIIGQLRTLGVSCDWSRQRFTMDEGLSAAVREVFVRLYEEGLLYRAERLVNWDPVAQTVLSDLEVLHEENVKGELWSFAYPLTNPTDDIKEIVVATTRPETMLADTGIAVHPDDLRYKIFIGKTVTHPLNGREIPIIADAILVDPAFGTGAVKLTPAHDFNDFEVAKRHHLPLINMFNPDATVNAVGGRFEGLTREKARIAVKEAIAELGLDRGSQDHMMNVGRSERSNTIAEPMISKQWYVNARALAGPALAAVENGTTKFVPSHWENTYYAWLRNIKDWCVSRQLWWGHQIPAWYCQNCQQEIVTREDPTACPGCSSTNITRDPDILDTWFSSALWAFSTMGWPAKTPDLKRWYPTAVLTTGFDIIFFWVARMMMFGIHFMGHVPFADVYIHALIRDAKGEKMSKTKGNVVDPLVMIEKYGCDAFRFTMIAFAGQGRDVRWDESRAEGYSKFCNKIWQAFRFSLQNTAERADANDGVVDAETAAYREWILSKRDHTIVAMRAAFETYRFNDAASALYAFIWDDFCDWYLELAKTSLYGETSGANKSLVQQTLLEIFDSLARMMHPVMPFLSEEIWQTLPNTEGSVMQARYPEPRLVQNTKEYENIECVKSVITAIRRIRAEFTVSPKDKVNAYIQTNDAVFSLLKIHQSAIEALGKASLNPLTSDLSLPKRTATEVLPHAEVRVPLEGLVDFAAESDRLRKELVKVQKDHEKIDKQLSNADFVARAPEEIVAEKNAQIAACVERMQQLTRALDRIA